MRRTLVMENKIQIAVDRAPALRNQSQAIRCENLVYVSGQTGCDPATGSLAEGLDAQTERMLANLDAILAAAGCDRKDIVAVTLMFSEIGHFKRVDEIYAQWSPARETIPLPACNAFASKNLPGGALVQIDAIAAIP
ncbi:MAG TPA: Rid family hydrolase [Chthoniobacterales bacterium]|nr:Rid family hydrolase [Chthoniobacterales bacterium]